MAVAGTALMETGDAGNPAWYQPSQEWSNTAVGFTDAGAAVSKGFDGDIASASLSSTDFSYNNLNLTGVVTLEVGGSSGSSDSRELQCQINNDASTLVSVTSTSNNYVFTLAQPAGGILNSIEFFKNGNPYTGSGYVRVNNKLLVDSSVPGGQGETTVDKSIAYAGQLTVASDSKLAEITGGVYMTDGTFKTDGSGEYAPADYTLTTSTIASVAVSNAWDQRIVWSNDITQFGVNGGTPTGFTAGSPGTNAFNGSVDGNSNAAQCTGTGSADSQIIAECLFTLFDSATSVHSQSLWKRKR